MQKVSIDGQDLLSSVFQIKNQFTGVEELCDDMIRVDVSSQEDQDQLQKMKADEEAFSTV